jgi:cytochrome b involved in lipid metabolism
MMMTIAVHNDYPTKIVAEPTVSRSNIWKIYGHEYDLSDFVQQHPGGVESIMLAANREDATALFQSYHAFNIRKVKAILEKYRISKVKSPEDEKQLQGNFPIGHHNDLMYEEMVKRVSKKLLDNGVDPVKDRYASWTRYVLYAGFMSSMLISGYFHLQVRIVWDLPLQFTAVIGLLQSKNND